MPEKTADLPAWLVELYPPDRRIAVEFFRKLVGESMLLEIAKACNGMEVEEQLASLMPIWNGEDWSELHCWFPMEVLELMRWIEPENPHEWAPGHTGLRGHQIRAFCCAVLLTTSNFEANNYTLINLLDSAFSIGGEAPQSVARFLTWKFPSFDSGEDRPLFALALAAIVRIGRPDLSEERERELVDWIESENASAPCDPPWLDVHYWNSETRARWKGLVFRLQRGYKGGALAELLSDYESRYKSKQLDQ